MLNTALASERGLAKTLFLLAIGILSPGLLIYLFHTVCALVETAIRGDW